MSDSLRTVRLESFDRALSRLESALAQPKTEWTRDSSIQRFEFTFELAWKTLAWLVRGQGLEARSPRESLKQAFALGWIDDEDRWLRMLDDRNRASHTYDEALAEDLYGRLASHARDLRQLHGRLTVTD